MWRNLNDHLKATIITIGIVVGIVLFFVFVVTVSWGILVFEGLIAIFCVGVSTYVLYRMIYKQLVHDRISRPKD